MLPLTGRRVLIFVHDEYEDLELWYPKLRLQEAGAEVTVAGFQANYRYHGKHSYPCTSDAAIAEVRGEDFHAVVLPGGWAPDKLRRDEKVLGLTRHFWEAGKPVAAICHGGWIAASAGIVRGVTLTGSPGIKDDLVHAGAEWVDAPVHVDRHFVSSRKPDDLPAFCAGLIKLLGEPR